MPEPLAGPARGRRAPRPGSAGARPAGNPPANQREVIRLKFQNGFSYQEISRISGHSVSNVGYLIHAGIKTLRGNCSTASRSRPEPESRKGEPEMTFDTDDPRLTAYALGELDPARMARDRAAARP